VKDDHAAVEEEKEAQKRQERCLQRQKEHEARKRAQIEAANNQDAQVEVLIGPKDVSLAVAAAAIEKVTGKRAPAPTNQRRTNRGESATEDRAYISVSKEEQVAKSHCAAVHLKAELDDSRRLQREVRRKRRAAEKAGHQLWRR
jgi:hypothetical protein